MVTHTLGGRCEETIIIMCYFNESAGFTQPYLQFHSDVLPLTGKLVEVFSCCFHLTAVTPVEQQSVRGFDAEKQDG